MNNKTKGYIYGAVAAATYGMNPLFALPLYQDGMDADSVLFFRYLLAIPILWAMIRWRGRDFRLTRRELPALVVLGLLMACSSLTLFLSYTYMAAGIASTLLFVYPILVALIMAIFFKEKISLLTVMCIALALVGIAMLYKGDGDATLSLAGVALVMASSLSYAIYMVGVNLPRVREVPTVKLTFYALLFGFSVFVELSCHTLYVGRHVMPYPCCCILRLCAGFIIQVGYDGVVVHAVGGHFVVVVHRAARLGIVAREYRFPVTEKLHFIEAGQCRSRICCRRVVP